MAPISKKRAAMEMQSYHQLVTSLNMTGYSSDSSNQGSSETSNSSSNNINLNVTNNALNLHDNSLQLNALQSLNALGLAAHHSHLTALHRLNHSQLMNNLSTLSSLSTASNATTVSNNNSSTNSNNSSELSTVGKQYAKVNRVVLDKNSDEYRRRRERNNLAVKKSRTKSKIKTLETLQRVKLLKAENDELKQKVQILSKELLFLKDIFKNHALRAHGAEISDKDLDLLIKSKIFTNFEEQEDSLNLDTKLIDLINQNL